MTSFSGYFLQCEHNQTTAVYFREKVKDGDQLQKQTI